jgi:two-component system sensor histidine kinase PilS (NtrC family)
MVVLNLVVFYVVAAYSGRHATRLRGSANQLAKTTQRFSELRAFNERVIDSISSGLLTTDLEGRVKTFNRSAENITGFKFATVYDKPVSTVFGDISKQIGASLEGRSRKARVLRFTTHCKTADNRNIFLGFSASPLVDEDGVHTGVVISFQDLTEVSKLEREMRRQDRLVSLGKMAAAIAHEVRNPLASMRGAIQVLHSEMAPESEQAELMQIVLRESDRLNGIVTDFLSYARPQMPAKQTFDICPLIGETVLLMRHSSELVENHNIVEEYPADPVNIEGDPNQIKQVCWNLTRNALQAMPNGGTLTVRVVNAADTVTIEVADSGHGMKDEQVERMFEPFSTDKAGGTGLGLAIVHQIITDHGGRIDVSSVVGQGTKILIMLPAFTESNVCEEQKLDWALPENNVAGESLTV